MQFDLSKKIVNRAGQDVVYPSGGKNVQHDVGSLITEALWEAGGSDLRTAVKMGVLADRLQRSPDRAAVEISDGDLQLIGAALNVVRYPAYLAAQILEAVPKLGEE